MTLPSSENQAPEALLRRGYAAFNARDLEGALALLHPDVDWPNGTEGGTVSGRDGVREYWTRQWATIDPTVEPLEFQHDASGRIVVRVHQVVRDLAGALLTERVVEHVYAMTDGLIRSMQIREAAQPGQ
jgi:ketosteroid isomerase-like protein